MPLNLSNQLNHVDVIFTWFDFKPELDKELDQEIFSVIFIFFLISFSDFFYRSAGFFLNRPSQLDHDRTTSTLFNFKLVLSKELDFKINTHYQI